MRSHIIFLNRGGQVFTGGTKPVQLGIPPETIKDTMQLPCGVPDIYIVPQYTFSPSGGISLSELEFPIFYNYYVKQRRTRVICNQDQAERLSVVLQEAIFGPEHLDYENEFSRGKETPGYPDLKAEMAVFKTLKAGSGVEETTMDDMVEFHILDAGETIIVDNLKFESKSDHRVAVLENGKEVAGFDRKKVYIPLPEVSLANPANFHPPLFGLTTLGTGHGFDPQALTSGMIIWINRRGIIVDPPVNSTPNLISLGVNPKTTDSLILTHCHADHDSGTLQKIMQEGRIRLYTTLTIYNSFIRKSAALTGIDVDRLKSLIEFLPVTIGEPTNINGGDFIFNYNLHSIPTIRIEACYLGKSIVYSSDTMGDPDFINDLHVREIISRSRRDFLLDFPWHKDIVIHEAGTPPIHTPIKTLLSQPEEVRRKMYLVHVSKESIPEDSLLKIAPAGLSNTIELPVEAPYFDEAMEALNLFLNVDVFRGLDRTKACQFLGIVEKESFTAGEYILREGERSSSFYIIASGCVDVTQDNQVLTTYSNNDYFGEKALFSNEPRTASVIARTDVVVFRIRQKKMLRLIHGTSTEFLLRRLADRQSKTMRYLFGLNKGFSQLTPTQHLQLFEMVDPLPEPVQPETEIVTQGRPLSYCYFIQSGEVAVLKNHTHCRTLTAGDLFGVQPALSTTDFISPYTYITRAETQLIRMAVREFKAFADKNPGIFIKLYYYPD